MAPRCRVAGRIAVATRAPTTTLRFDGRVGGRALGDGTYVLETPSRSVRFAIVDGRPTLARGSFAASTCAGGGAENGVATAAPAAGSRPKPARLEPAAAAELRRPEPRRVLGVAFEDAAEAALGLHPALYALLALAIALLATASVPAARVPSAGAAALLARRRADLTLAGLLTLMVVVAGCLITLV